MPARRPSRRRWWVAAAVALAGCAGAGGGSGHSLTVLAASSLTEPFAVLGRRFEKAHPGTRVELAFAASSTLGQQVRAGAPADVVATADVAVVERLAREGLAGRPRVFARNRLALAVAEGNPRRVGSLDDVGRQGLDLVVCAPEVPCGRLAARALAAAAVPIRPRSYEPNVKAVLARVALGEADAGLVYATDVRSAGNRADGVALAEGDGLVTDYAVAPLRDDGDADLAAAFVALVRSAEGRRQLVAAGFEVP